MLKRPAIFHGMMAGLVLFAVKLVLVFTGNWIFRLQNTYNMLAFLLVILAIIFSGMAEKRRQRSVSYGRALLNALVTISVVIFLSLLGDQVAYRTQPKLAAEAKEYQIQEASKNLNKVAIFSDSYKDKFLSTLEETNPKDLYSISTFFSSWFIYIFLDGLWALLLAIFLRKRGNPLQEDLLE